MNHYIYLFGGYKNESLGKNAEYERALQLGGCSTLCNHFPPTYSLYFLGLFLITKEKTKIIKRMTHLNFSYIRFSSLILFVMRV